MPDLRELSDRLRASLDVPSRDDDDLLLPTEVELRYLRETVLPVTTDYAESLAGGGATESAGHVVRLVVVVSESVLGRDALGRPSFESMRAVLDELRDLADEWTAGGAASGSPAEAPALDELRDLADEWTDSGAVSGSLGEPPALAYLESGAESGGLGTAELMTGLDEVACWLEEPGRSFDEDAGADLLRRIDAVGLAPRVELLTVAQALELFELRGRCHERLVPIATI